MFKRHPSLRASKAAQTFFFLSFALLAISSCAQTGGRVDDEEMRLHESAITKLASAMEAYVRYGNPRAGMTEEQMLVAGTKHDPTLLTGLGNYRLRLMNSNKHAVILMCDPTGSRRLLEDAGCSGRLEARHWAKPAAPCEFTVVVSESCSGK